MKWRLSNARIVTTCATTLNRRRIYKKSKTKRHIPPFYRTRYSTFKMRNCLMKSTTAMRIISNLICTRKCRGKLTHMVLETLQAAGTTFTQELSLIHHLLKDSYWVTKLITKMFPHSHQGIQFWSSTQKTKVDKRRAPRAIKVPLPMARTSTFRLTNLLKASCLISNWIRQSWEKESLPPPSKIMKM